MAHTLDASARYPATANTTNAANPVGGANGFTYAIGANATVLAVGLISATTTPRAGGNVTVNAINMTQARANSAPGEASAEIWYLLAPPTGTQSIVIPNSGTIAIKVFIASFVAASGNASVFDAANGATATAANATVNVSASVGGDAVFGVVASGLNDFPTSANAQTGTLLYEDDCGAWGGGSQYLLPANSGTITVGWTCGSEDYAALAASFKEEASTSGAISQTLASITTSIEGTVTSVVVGDVTQTLGAVAPTITGTVEGFFKLFASDNIAASAATATTAQLTAPANKSVNDFQAGKISDDTNPLPSINLDANKYTELEWSIRAAASTANGQVFTFRVTDSGTSLSSYAANGTWTVGATNAAVNQTLASLVLDANGTVEAVASGAISQTLASVTILSDGTVAVSAGVQQGLADAALSAAATVFVEGAVSQTLGTLAPTIEGQVASAPPTNASLDQVLGFVAIDATATVSVAGTISQGLGSVLLDSSGTVAVAGEASQTLGAVTPAVAVTVAVTGAVGQTLASLACTFTGTLASVAQGEVQQTFASLAIDATGAVAVQATIGQTLAAVSRSVAGAVAVNAAITQTLASTTANIAGLQGTPTAFNLSASSYIPANAATSTTGQLTPPSGKTVNGYFQTGKLSDDTNPLPSIDLIVDTYTELEWSIKSTTAAVNTANYQFRVTDNGTALDTYSVTPTWQVLNPINGTVSQTLGALGITFTGEIPEPGSGRVVQTLASLGATIEGTVGYPAGVSTTLGSVSQPFLYVEVMALSGGAPTFWNVYFGHTSGFYDHVIPIPYAGVGLYVLVQSIAPEPGEWYVVATLANDDGESAASNELFVVSPAFTGTVVDVFDVVVSQTLNPLGRAILGRVIVRPTVAHTLASVALSATGTVAVKGAVSKTLGPVQPTITASGSATTCNGAVAQTLNSVGLTASGSVYEVGETPGWVDSLLDEVQRTIAGAVAVTGSVSQELASVGLTTLGGRMRSQRQTILLDGSDELWRS